VGKNSQNKNVLSIVIAADMDKVFGPRKVQCLPLWGSQYGRSTSDPRDHEGPFKMTNITLSLKQFDQVNKDLDVGLVGRYFQAVKGLH